MIFMIFIIFIFGVSMGNDETDHPVDELIEAATSDCEQRETVSGDTLTVDVDERDAVNLKAYRCICFK